MHMRNRLDSDARTRLAYPQNRNPSSDKFGVIAVAHTSVDFSLFAYSACKEWIQVEPNAPTDT